MMSVILLMQVSRRVVGLQILNSNCSFIVHEPEEIVVPIGVNKQVGYQKFQYDLLITKLRDSKLDSTALTLSRPKTCFFKYMPIKSPQLTISPIEIELGSHK